MPVQSSSDESEEVIEEDLPTFNQACQALTTLRRFLKLKGGKDEDYRHIYDLDSKIKELAEKNRVQMRIDQYFK